MEPQIKPVQVGLASSVCFESVDLGLQTAPQNQVARTDAEPAIRLLEKVQTKSIRMPQPLTIHINRAVSNTTIGPRSPHSQ